MLFSETVVKSADKPNTPPNIPSAYAAVATAKASAAISSILLAGPQAPKVIEAVFKTSSGRNFTPAPGRLCTGLIQKNTSPNNFTYIDQVVLACAPDGSFHINCHGNPLVVELIMQQLKTAGSHLIPIERYLYFQHLTKDSPNTIDFEASLLKSKSATLKGFKALSAQTDSPAGLKSAAQNWLNILSSSPDSTAFTEIIRQCTCALDRFCTMRFLIEGAKVVLAGPPNAGKSSLLNAITGRQTAITVSIPGTTRDYISAQIAVNDDLFLELIDTAGLGLETASAPDKAAQIRTAELIKTADAVILLIDGTAEKIDNTHLDIAKTAKRLVVAINKCDLPLAQNIDQQLKNLGIDQKLSQQVSALNRTGIEPLLDKLRYILGIKDFDIDDASVFTDRQHRIIKNVITALQAKKTSQAETQIKELLFGSIDV